MLVATGGFAADDMQEAHVPDRASADEMNTTEGRCGGPSVCAVWFGPRCVSLGLYLAGLGRFGACARPPVAADNSGDKRARGANQAELGPIPPGFWTLDL
jgi:hypothetical protein